MARKCVTRWVNNKSCFLMDGGFAKNGSCFQQASKDNYIHEIGFFGIFLVCLQQKNQTS